MTIEIGLDSDSDFHLFPLLVKLQTPPVLAYESGLILAK